MCGCLCVRDTGVGGECPPTDHTSLGSHTSALMHGWHPTTSAESLSNPHCGPARWHASIMLPVLMGLRGGRGTRVTPGTGVALPLPGSAGWGHLASPQEPSGHKLCGLTFKRKNSSGLKRPPITVACRSRHCAGVPVPTPQPWCGTEAVI